MSAFADQPNHFVDWLACQSPQLLDRVRPTEAAFVPRRLYGAYLRHLLNTAPGSLETLHDSVVAIQDGVLRLASGHTIGADAVVLATGNDRPAAPDARACRHHHFGVPIRGLRLHLTHWTPAPPCCWSAPA